LAWNADGTRLPARMHSEYLCQLFLDNDLAEGRFLVAGRPVLVSDIRVPFFVVGTEADRIAPWRSVHKIHLLNEGDITFILIPAAIMRGLSVSRDISIAPSACAAAPLGNVLHNR
jgi:polyhydroxyalkanoate synthase